MIIKKIVIGLLPCLLMLVCCKQREQKQETGDKSTIEKAVDSKNIVSSKMVHIPAGTFNMGTDDLAFPDAHPVHKVKVKEFWMDEHEVTNYEFEDFVKATNYITVAERQLDPKDYPGVPAESLVPGSAVFFSNRSTS